MSRHPQPHHVLEEAHGVVDAALVGEVGQAGLLAEHGLVELEPDEPLDVPVSDVSDVLPVLVPVDVSLSPVLVPVVPVAALAADGRADQLIHDEHGRGSEDDRDCRVSSSDGKDRDHDVEYHDAHQENASIPT